MADHNVLTEILEDLDKESQLRRLQLLKERLQHKTEVHQATVVSEVMRVTFRNPGLIFTGNNFKLIAKFSPNFYPL